MNGDKLLKYRFLNNVVKRNIWVESLGLKSVVDCHRVCSKHIMSQNYQSSFGYKRKLCPNAIPLQLLTTKVNKEYLNEDNTNVICINSDDVKVETRFEIENIETKINNIQTTPIGSLDKNRTPATEPPHPPFFGCPYMELSGKVAVITGGTQGVGLAVAKELIRKGASRVIVAGRDVQTGAKAIKMLNGMCSGTDQKAVYVPTDVTSRDELKNLFDYTIQTHGGLDILMNSAGILNESTKWRRMIDVNVKALIESTELGAKLMSNSKKPGGVIVNQSAIFAIKPQPQLPIFSATKAAVLAATVAFSKMNYDNVRFLTACMGPTDTPMLLKLAHDDLGEWAKDQQENLLDVLKSKQNVEKAAQCIAMMMQSSENGSTCLVASGRLHRKETEINSTFKTRRFLKF